jgi:AraC-like DNA-binding protein
MSSTSFRPNEPASWKKAPISERREKRGALGPWQVRGDVEVRWREPSPGLEPFLYGHWDTRWDLGGGEPPAQEVLHHPCVNVVARSSGREVWGIRRKRWTHGGSSSGHLGGTRFRPGAFAIFAAVPVRLLNDRTVSVREALGDAGSAAVEAVPLDAPRDDFFDALEAFLVERATLTGRYELVRAVTESMRETPGEATVEEIARQHDVSVRALQSAFREYVGVGPKWALKRYRMHEATERIATGDYEDAASLATDLGYFDQAHFIRDFKAQVGVSPGAYERACRERSREPGAVSAPRPS